jgi:hypothetical protein
MTTLNAQTENQAVELLKELGAVEFEKRNEIGKYGQDIIKVVGMDRDFEVLGYAIIDLN